jgi:hypothetical protein
MSVKTHLYVFVCDSLETCFSLCSTCTIIFNAFCVIYRKLPKSQAILFGIRSYQRYLEDFSLVEHESDARALLRAVELLPPTMLEYTHASGWRDAALHYLKSVLPEPAKSQASPKL